MNRTNPVYFFVVFISLFIGVFGFTIVFLGFGAGNVIVLAILIILLIIALLVMAIKLSDGTLEQRGKIYTECPNCRMETETNGSHCKHCGGSLRSTQVCDYCGYENPINSDNCLNCNANM